MNFSAVVESILDKNPSLCIDLSEVCDNAGRSALDVAIPECRLIILQSLYFMKLYEICDNKPLYKSKSCLIYVAIDHSTNQDFALNRMMSSNKVMRRSSVAKSNVKKVALKFLKCEDAYKKEVSIRSDIGLSPRHVIQIINHYQSKENEEFKKHLIRKGLQEFPYLFIMPLWYK